MNNQYYQDKYPLTYEVAEKTIPMKYKNVTKKFLYFFEDSKMVLCTSEDHDKQVNASLNKVNEPILTLCEELLKNKETHDYSQEDKDKFQIVPASFLYEINYEGVEVKFTPDVTVNKEEHNLLVETVNTVQYYNNTLKPRNDLMGVLDKLVEICVETNFWAMDMVLEESEKETFIKETLKWKEKGDMIASLSEKRIETLCKDIDFEKVFKSV